MTRTRLYLALYCGYFIGITLALVFMTVIFNLSLTAMMFASVVTLIPPTLALFKIDRRNTL